MSEARRTMPALVLAAGASRRMGTPKALLQHGERAFVEIAAEALWRGGADPVVVVTRRDLENPVRERLARLPRPFVPHLAVNPDPDRGMLSSIIAGLDYLDAVAGGGAWAWAGFVLALVDQPLLSPAIVARVLEAAALRPDAIVIPALGERGGHPVVFPAACVPEFRMAPPDEGARAITRRDPGRVVRVPFADLRDFLDVDTPEDLRHLLPGDVPGAGAGGNDSGGS